MTYSDYIIIQVLINAGEQSLCVDDIARLSPVPLSSRTVERCLKRLLENSQIVRVGGGRGRSKGFIYRVVQRVSDAS